MKIEHYQSDKGCIPFEEWFDSLDGRHQAAIERRVAAVEEHDHLGDCRSLRGGLYEMRLLGPGLRIYFANVNNTIVLARTLHEWAGLSVSVPSAARSIVRETLRGLRVEQDRARCAGTGSVSPAGANCNTST